MSDEPTVGKESRRAGRAKVYYMAQLTAHGELRPVKLLDVSYLGVLIESDVALFALDEVALIRGDLRIPCRVAWSEGKRAGLEFTDPPDPDVVADKLGPRRSGSR